jgi:hypothetical protein
MNLIRVRSYLGVHDFFLACPSGVARNDAVKIVNGLITQAQQYAQSSLPSEATGGDFDKAVKEHLDAAFATGGYTVVDLDRLPCTKAWNR